jgi:hypothetical protein
MTKEPAIQFHAVPGHHALCHSWCGYMVMSLPALALKVTTDQVELVTVDGIEREFRPMCKDTLMLIPSIGHKLRAQVVRVYLTGESEAPKPFKPNQAPPVPPVESWGFTPSNFPTERSL